MEFSIADVLVHIDESLSKEALVKLGEAVRTDECVISAGVPSGNMHLMLVAYNPECTSGKNILLKVKDTGVHAELVGL
ncbi:MAG: ATP-binding protein [Gammaproteobacteria bacterium]|nr:ATP-binding protein [Rhodocyclaceae bacterium]MBU3909695.1 ATP-binding protein [Gammaproteobacteria bacterium]MBU3989293.1 ATP-binding protein [Gammaproteobacteria bacterium]MBU4005228.1 ATP-binding protein [Gammaproteobacteria bacterium]MBU4022407.1 ATP-binding protein [Gammaproteobacteria bacterium]